MINARETVGFKRKSTEGIKGEKRGEMEGEVRTSSRPATST